ncbi:MAG: DUF1643 domain-containing protein [Cyanobacteria bacterium J06638_7]
MSRGSPLLTGRARFSACGQYRWWLERCWQPGAPRLLFIGLNPSRADAGRDDPTLRRLLGCARGWGYGALEVLNLFAAISPSPAALRRRADPVGGLNDAWIRRRLAATAPAALWLGWGAGGGWRGRDRAVLQLLGGRRLLALGLTRGGHPRHPLYLPAGLHLQPWSSDGWRAPIGLGHCEAAAASPAAHAPCPPTRGATPFTCT